VQGEGLEAGDAGCDAWPSVPISIRLYVQVRPPQDGRKEAVQLQGLYRF